MKPQKMLHEDFQVDRLVSLIKISNSLGKLNKIPKKILEYIGFYTDEHQKDFISQNDEKLSKFNDKYVNALHVLLEEIAKNSNKISGIINEFQEVLIPYKGNHHYLDFLLNICETKGQFPYKKTKFLPNINPNGKNPGDDMEGSPYELTISGHITNTLDFHIKNNFEKYLDPIMRIIEQDILKENEYRLLSQIILDRQIKSTSFTSNNQYVLQKAIGILCKLNHTFPENQAFPNPNEPLIFSSPTFFNSCKMIITEFYKESELDNQNSFSAVQEKNLSFWLYYALINSGTKQNLIDINTITSQIFEIDCQEKEKIINNVYKRIPRNYHEKVFSFLLQSNKNEITIEIIAYFLFISKNSHHQFIYNSWDLFNIPNYHRKQYFFALIMKVLNERKQGEKIANIVINDGFMIKYCSLYPLLLISPSTSQKITKWLYKSFENYSLDIWNQYISSSNFIELICILNYMDSSLKFGKSYSDFLISLGKNLITSNRIIEKSVPEKYYGNILDLSVDKTYVINSINEFINQNRKVNSDDFFFLFGQDNFNSLIHNKEFEVISDVFIQIITNKQEKGIDLIYKISRRRRIKSYFTDEKASKMLEELLNLKNQTDNFDIKTKITKIITSMQGRKSQKTS